MTILNGIAENNERLVKYPLKNFEVLYNDENHYFNFCFYDIYYKFSEYFHITLSESEHTKNLTWNQISLHDRSISPVLLSRDDLRIHFYDLQYLDFDRLRGQKYDFK